MGPRILHLGAQRHADRRDLSDKLGLSLPLTGAIKEVVKEARRVKAANPPNWTGNKPLKYE
jgi:hypothetical protein